MDDMTFDRFAKSFSSGPSRRTILGLLAGAAFGRLADLADLEEARAGGKKKGGNKKKGNGKKHKKKKKRDEPKGKPCGDEFCNENQCCYLGHCIDKSLCCNRDSDCNACSRCENGLCVADPAKEGKACKGCLECVNGACGVPNNDFCPDGQQCRGGSGECCAKCINDRCCAEGSVCINPGPFSANSCCDTSVNKPCGDNGDGTFKECCNPRTEECVDGTCELKPACEGDFAAQELCCPAGTKVCPGLTGPFCAPFDHRCCGDASCDSDASQVCCDPAQSLCCARGNCAEEERQCCTDGRKACFGKCVDTQTDRRNCGRCDSWCDSPGFECCSGSCKHLENDEENCGACGNVCNPLSEVCVDGQCREICSLNSPGWQNACDDGVDHWCCPDGSTQCCRLSGQPHCC